MARSPRAAARDLQALLDRLLLRDQVHRDFEAWRASAVAIIESALGAGHPIATRLDAVNNVIGARAGLGGLDLFPGVSRAEGLIKAAIGELLSLPEAGEPSWSPMTIDAGLWSRVERMVASDDWGNVAASAVIYVEDWMRTRAGDPPNRRGGRLLGEALYAQVLGSDSPLRLGKESGEWQGWMKLGMGLAQAVGNVDRHRLQNRGDVRAYAMGVLGLCSLLITQMKHEHGETP